ncbi:CrcB-like protein-domain-containing protein [Multifurca ochricompacta]|uniref:CrcB-like protein-domain-containing protein n=1 Tax=Multifurca ochricompacta TaxID=376703 RepID=A0AAD4QSR2_9AGAM|nr:CrcB-like protein-domain-containing protein [Multifurca ochricompacta]
MSLTTASPANENCIQHVHVLKSPPTGEQNSHYHHTTTSGFYTTDSGPLASTELPSSEPDVTPQDPAQSYHPFSPAVIAPLMPASVFGVLARLGLQALATYDGKSVFPLAFPQSLGCLIIGVALPLKDVINGYHGPLYTAITTGFCGSLTTFSGWQLDIFDSWINEGQFHRSGLRNVVDAFTKISFTFLISLASLSFGVHIGTALLPFIPRTGPLTSAMRRAITVLSIMIYLATFPTYFRLSASFRHQATAALLFSFPGTLTRYMLSILLNPRSKLLPVGTLVANELGTSLLALFHVLQGLPRTVSPNACSILQGLEDGYCGCLTTVSTFVAEMSALAIGKRWLYATISIVMGQVLMVLILGSTVWTGNVSAQVRCTFVDT